jgi:hypothetical protein
VGISFLDGRREIDEVNGTLGIGDVHYCGDVLAAGQDVFLSIHLAGASL